MIPGFAAAGYPLDLQLHKQLFGIRMEGAAKLGALTHYCYTARTLLEHPGSPGG
jgi:hypothetical protein